MAVVAWTTLCLGGYLAKTMIVTGPVVLGLGALGGLLWAAGQGAESRVINRAVFLPVPFLLYALASVLWQAPAAWLAWREWLLWFQMWLVFALVLHFGRSRAHTWIIVLVIAGLAFAGVVMAAYQRFSDPRWMMLGRKQVAQFVGRSGGMFGIPNSFAGLLELVIPVCLALVFSRAVKPWVKVICCWLGALFVFAIMLTGSRGGWLGLGLALMIWPLLAGRTWRWKITGTAVVFGCVFAGLLAVYQGSDYARERMQPFLRGEFERSRPIVWKAGYEIWQEHPLFGTGTASYNVLFERYRPGGFWDEPQWTHNEYLNTLSDYGLAGFVLWAGAGAALLVLGWMAIGRARRAGASAANVFALAKWKFGLFVGLLAYAIHLCVDFHTRIPALAFLAAISVALLLRDEPGLRRPVPALIRWTGGALLAVIAGGLVWRVALPLYRAEALRFEARGAIDRYARTKQGNLGAIASAARSTLSQAVRIDPTNGQAWSDLAYVTVMNSRGAADLVMLGYFAELAANEAIKQCAINAEFWVRKGVALDVQRGRPEAEECFRHATELAPQSAPTWYAYASHLQAFPNRQDDARKALYTCLALDPYYPPADILRRKLVPSR
jgi:O-antigen ligase